MKGDLKFQLQGAGLTVQSQQPNSSNLLNLTTIRSRSIPQTLSLSSLPQADLGNTPFGSERRRALSRSPGWPTSLCDSRSRVTVALLPNCRRTLDAYKAIPSRFFGRHLRYGFLVPGVGKSKNFIFFNFCPRASPRLKTRPECVLATSRMFRGLFIMFSAQSET